VSEIMYSNFVMNGTRPFANVPKPHDRITLIELRNDTHIKPFTAQTFRNVNTVLEVSGSSRNIDAQALTLVGNFSSVDITCCSPRYFYRSKNVVRTLWYL